MRRWILLSLALGCADKGGDSDPAAAEGPCGAQKVVVVGGQPGQTCGDACPEGTFEQYTDGYYLACSACQAAEDCAEGETCDAECGPGCEDDAGGCCPLYSCYPPP